MDRLSDLDRPRHWNAEVALQEQDECNALEHFEGNTTRPSAFASREKFVRPAVEEIVEGLGFDAESECGGRSCNRLHIILILQDNI